MESQLEVKKRSEVEHEDEPETKKPKEDTFPPSPTSPSQGDHQEDDGRVKLSTEELVGAVNTNIHVKGKKFYVVLISDRCRETCYSFANEGDILHISLTD